jgi:AraC-like DNA-binding protein
MTDLVRSAALTDYVEVARAVGLDPYRMLDALGLGRAALRDPDAKVSAAAVRRLFEASARAAGIDDFGLRLAEKRELSNLGPLALVVREQPTIRKALDALIQYIRLHNESLLVSVHEEGDAVVISPVLKVGRPVPTRQSVELTIGVLYRILRMLLGEGWKPRAIRFAHQPPAKLDRHRRFFRAPIEFGAEVDGLVCAARDLDAPVAAADPAMARHVQRYLDGVIARPNVTLGEKVREMVATLLPSGGCSIAAVAERLGVDRRTLHRRLARQGDTYSAIVDAARTEMVARYLDNRERSLATVADLLGFSALSAFSRWFRTRFGCSATAWRADATPGPRRSRARRRDHRRER